MAIESQDTTIEIESGAGAAQNISAITEAAIAKVTFGAAHGFSVGDVVTFAAIGGMVELNGTTTMVIAVEGTTIIYIDVDTTGYTTYTSGGTATAATYTVIGEVVSIDRADDEAAEIPTTHLLSTRHEYLMGIPGSLKANVSVNFIPDNAGQLACRAAQIARTLIGFRITYSDGGVRTFDGYVMGLSENVAVDGKADGTISIRGSGADALT
jgi:hypothetical protein